MRTLAIGLAALALLGPGAAVALDAGVASGRYAKDGVSLGFRHAVALSQDNAEGLLDHGPQMRVLLSDEEVPVSALYGIAFPPVRQLARDGQVHGVLLEFNPADRTALEVTILSKPTEPGAFAPTLSLSNSKGVWKKLDANAARVAGDYAGDADDGLAFSFSAPVATDPVQADLKGPDAQASEPMKVLVARAQAIGRADLSGALALSSRTSGLRQVPPAQIKQASSQAAEMLKQLRAAKRVVIRRETAVAILPDGWASLVREDGAWKVAD